MTNTNIKSDQEVLDWIAENVEIPGAFVLAENPDENSEEITIEHYALKYDLTLKDALRVVISRAIDLDLVPQDDIDTDSLLPIGEV